MPLWISLLRGINVGGRNRVQMADLRALYESQGLTEVTSYIQSGNLLFVSPIENGADLSAAVGEAIEQRFGFAVAVTHRRASELAAVVDASPYGAIGADEKQLGVVLLHAEPTESAWATLDPDRSPPDVFSRGEQAIHVHVPNGFAKTKLTNKYFEKCLGVAATTRNWRTMNTLVDRTQSAPYV